MKAFLFDLVNKLQRTSNSLDAKAILCNKTWRVFSDTGEKEVYIFMEDGKLVISVNGAAVIGSWMYIPANQSLVISGNNQNFLVHPIICNNVLALALDGSNQCCFLLDSTKEELDRINSLRSIESYINKNANKIPLISNSVISANRNVCIQGSLPSDAIYLYDSRLKLIDIGDSAPSQLYIKTFWGYKKYTGRIYSSRHHVVSDWADGDLWRLSFYHKNMQLAVEEIMDKDGNTKSHNCYDENGYELSEEEFDLKYHISWIDSEIEEIDNIPKEHKSGSLF